MVECHIKDTTKSRTKMINRNHLIKIFPKYVQLLDILNRNTEFFDFKRKNIAEKIIQSNNRFDIHDYVFSKLGNITIDYLEFGVYKGDSLFYWAGKNTNTDSRFFGFDSFEGLPEDWEKNHPKGFFSTNGKMPQTNDRRIQFIKGWFNDTIPTFKKTFIPKNPLIIHIDSDLYSSALYILTQFDEMMQNDTIIILDEFGNLLHEFSAWQDYIQSYKRKFRILCAFPNYKRIAIELTDA